MIIRFFVKCLLFYFCLGTELTEKSAHVANRVFRHRQVSCVISKHSDPETVNRFLKLFQGLALIVSVEQEKIIHQNELARCEQTVVFASQPEEFQLLLDLIKNLVKETIYMVLIITKSVASISVLTDFTKLAWENDIGNIIILSSNEKIDSVNVTTYIPYSRGKCDVYDPVIINYEENINFVKKYRNFQQCPIKLTGVNLPPYITYELHKNGVAQLGGLDGDILNVVLEKLNATTELVQPEFSAIGEYVNGSGVGVFADLVHGKFDIMLPGIAINVRRYATSQLSHVYQSVDVVWCGPNRREIYPWAKVLLPFFSNKTPFISLAFVLFIATVLLIERFGVKKVKFKNITFETSALFLGQTSNFERNYWLSNSIFVIWIWFCLVIRVAYQGDLINNFGLIILEPPMTKINEALQSVDGHGGSAGYARYFRNTGVEKNYDEHKFEDSPIYLKQISEGRRYLVIIDELLVWYVNKPVQILEERMTRVPVCFYLRPRWPPTKEIDDTIVKVMEAGIVAKALRRFKDKPLFKDVTEVDVIKPIELSTLSACFYGLFMMYVVCILIFCFEVFNYKFKRRNKK